MNVYQKIAKVMADVAYLTKDDSVETGGGKSYRAITEEKVTSTVRASLLKHGLVIVPVEQTHDRVDERVTAYDKYQKKDVEKINRVTTVNVTYKVQNIDDLNDYVLVQSTGTGVDTQDKGVGKAMTYAYKYMLLRTFAIPTGEDPDKISSDIYTEKLTGEKDRPKPIKQPSDDAFNDFVNAEDKISKAQSEQIISVCTDEEITKLCKSRGVASIKELTSKQAEGIISGLKKQGRII